MATNQFVMAAIGLAGVNAALLGVLGGVWLRNYRRFQSGLVLGLVAFSAALLVENLVAVVFFLDSMTMFYASDPLVGRIVFVMRTLEFVAIAFLAYVTLR
ncbi:MAG: hypothetical protein ABEH61_03250 [Haloarculaceae archaeon]